MKRLVGLFFLYHIYMSMPLQAQHSVLVRNASDGASIPQVYLMLTGQDGKTHSLAANADGLLVLPDNLSFPCEAVFRHLNFRTKVLRWADYPSGEVRLTPSVYRLEQVVVTGQIAPQSIDESVFAVRTVDAQTIRAQGATDLGEVLSNQLNLTLTPNKEEGRVSASMLGLGSAYVKVLIDGVPFVGAAGNGNEVDLSQINLHDVAQIEIVEGSMAVSYGANAVAGVINIITKQASVQGLSVSADLQEETVGGEYGTKKGKHIQTLGIGYKLKKPWRFLADFRRTDFKGFWGLRAGENYTGSEAIRGFEWQPKRQNMFSFKTAFQPKVGNFSYKATFFTQKMRIPSAIVRFEEHPATKIRTYYGQDRKLYSERMVHNLAAAGKIGTGPRYSLIAAYSTFWRKDKTQIVRIPSQQSEKTLKENNDKYNALMSRGKFFNFIGHKKIDLELGYEFEREQITNPQVAKGARKQLSTLAGFANSEFHLHKKISFRFGIRAFRHSLFPNMLLHTSHLKFSPSDFLFLRLGYGRAYRTPNLFELYYYFVDANHNLQGNPNLSPEDAKSFSFDTKYKPKIGHKFVFETSAKVFYNKVKDKISMALVDKNINAYKYINIHAFESKGVTVQQKISGGRVRFRAGFSYTGLRSDLRSTNTERPTEFLYGTELNSALMYSMRKPKLDWALFYKRTGKKEQFYRNNKGEYKKGRIAPFNWLDFTLGFSPLKHLKITAGARNLLNITNISTTAGQAGAHSSAATSIGLSYGRSYFLRIGFRFASKSAHHTTN